MSCWWNRLSRGGVLLVTLAWAGLPVLGADGSPPVVFSAGSFSNQVVGRGLGVQWSFSALGTPPFSYQWWHEDQPLLDATNRSLTLTNLQPGQSGVYYARVTNAAGSATTPAVRLTIVPGMEIRRIGAITNVQWVYTLDVVGHVAYVGVAGNGGGLKVYDLQDPASPNLIGGLALGTAQQYVSVSDVVVAGGRAYLAAADRGLQVLDVSDPTQPAVLGKFVVPNNAIDLVIREPLAYVATSRGVQWFKGGEPLINATNRTLRLAHVTTADAAEYSVAVENELGATSGGTARLQLVEPPRLELQGVIFGDSRGARLTLAAPAGVQARVMACTLGQSWSPLWSGRFGESPIEFFDPAVTSAARIYELLLGAP